MQEKQDTSILESPVRRIIEPFVYFKDHASAIPGLGGKSRSPNPNYCFHTHYFEYLPGIVLFHIRIINVRSSIGELEVRVHGYRPDNPDLGIKLVTAARISLVDIRQDELNLEVRISAIPGVHYAVFGHYTEPADLTASEVTIEAEEFGGEMAENFSDGNAPATQLRVEEPEAAGALVADRPAMFAMPASQCCTIGQLVSREFRELCPAGTSTDISHERLMALWRQVYPLQVLRAYGYLQTGATGLVLGLLPSTLDAELHKHDCLLASRTAEEEAHPALLLSGGGHYDFVICIDSSRLIEELGGLQVLVESIMRRLLRGGLAIVIIDFGAPGSVAEGRIFSRAQLEQLALRLIGHGSSVAQLNFPSGSGEDVAPAAVAPFVLVVRK